ncbi:MAG: CvpA family protein [Ignavibacteria bacterium]
MNWLDAVIAFVILLPAYTGYNTGFLRKIFGVFGLFLGFLLAINLLSPISDYVIGKFNTDKVVTYVVSFLVITAGVFWVLILAAGRIVKINAAVNLIDKISGVMLGIFQGLIIASIMLYISNYMNILTKNTRETSLLYNKVVNIAPYFSDKIISKLIDSKNFQEVFENIR